MTLLEIELKQLRQAILEMMALAKKQLEKSKDAFVNMDGEIAQEIIHTEKRINAMELSIDRQCENIFALFNPVATDLRFVIAMLKINSDLERIADYADGIADYVIEIDKPFSKDILNAVQMNEMFDIAISMVNDIYVAFDKEDTALARKVFKEDAALNEINAKASKIISEFVEETHTIFRSSLYLFSTIRKVERVGDHVKNVAEVIIFYLEAEVLKHKKKK
jgi:phosphate transport system protein